MEVPKFLRQEGNSLVYNNNDESTFVFYIPEVYFNDSKVPIAEISGQYVTSIGMFNWAIIDKNGSRRGKLMPFNFPTMFMCKPRDIEKVKNLKLDENSEESNYRILKFKYNDEIISQIRVPKLIDNVEMFFKMVVNTAKIPTTIPYDKIWELFVESARLNGFDYGLNVQLFGILISAICRDPNDISKPFKETDMSNMNNYKPINITMVPKFISPYTSITSENWDDAIRAAILMKDKDDAPVSPIEKIVTM